LVAELGASFLNAKAGISASTLSNSASYIASWISVLRRDSKMLIAAAGVAQKAADYILNVQTSSDSEK
jgi:antirestriction protein ArdC